MPLAEARESIHARSVTRRGVQGRGELGARACPELAKNARR
jgi:hypothetical protein